MKSKITPTMTFRTPTRISASATLSVVFAVFVALIGFASTSHGQTKPQIEKPPSSAKEAWAKLAGKGCTRPQFAFVENNPDLPNVLIYGDSISIGYTQRVRQKLAGKANVYRIFNNGSDSSQFIPKMKKMHQVMRSKTLDQPWTFDWDVIHFNVGLHDLKYLKDKKLDKQNGKASHIARRLREKS